MIPSVTSASVQALTAWVSWGAATASLALMQAANWLPDGSVERWGIVTFLCLALFSRYMGWWEDGPTVRRGKEEQQAREAEYKATILRYEEEAKTRDLAAQTMIEQNTRGEVQTQNLLREVGMLRQENQQLRDEISAVRGQLQAVLADKERMNLQRDETLQRLRSRLDEYEGGSP